MISVEQAFEIYQQVLTPLLPRSVPLAKALGGVLAEDVHSVVELPLFTQSALDGYALCAEDMNQAGEQGLPLAKQVAAAGMPSKAVLAPGQAMRIFTGGPLPGGANTIVAQEQAKVEQGRLYALKPLCANQGVRHRGEELAKSDLMARHGQRITPGLLAALAMAGHTELLLRTAPKVAVLVSGDEIAPSGQSLCPGQVFDANGPLMSSWLQQQGCPLPQRYYPTDDPQIIRDSLRQALAESDLVLSSGGVSVGDRDYIPEVAESLGLSCHFWNVAQKPGKPLWFGSGEAGVLLGIPGNPGAVWTCLQVHVARLLDLLQQVTPPRPHWQHGLLQTSVPADPVRIRWLRMCRHTDQQGQVLLGELRHQESHMLSNLAQADTVVWLPARKQAYVIGESVLWSPI